MPKKISVKKKQNIIIAVGWGVILIIASTYGVYRGATINKHSTVSKSNIAQVSDEGVTWLPEPQEIKIKEQLFMPDWEVVNANYSDEKLVAKYYKVGEDNGRDIVIAILPGIDPNGDRKIMMVRDGATYKMLPKYSNVNERTVYGGMGQYFGPALTSKVEEGNMIYHLLDAPATLALPQGNLGKVSGAIGKFFFSDYRTIDDTGVIEKFADTPWGTLYSYTRNGFGNGDDMVRIQQFILRLADGEAVPYQSHPQFIADDNVLLVTWNDGKKNTDAYMWNSLGGCGAPSYVAIVGDSKMKDLVPVGKSVMGDTIYGFKNLDNQTLKQYYLQLPEGKYYIYDQKTGESKQVAITIEEYNAQHGVVVYRDGFGRFITFSSQKYSSAECGKPVIYLYPTHTTSVSVTVGANVTKSEPEYKNGWNVIAHSDGSMVNADGTMYGSLFWEGTGHGTYPLVDSGFVVPQEKLKATLQNHLTKLGLNTQESKDFMEFWMPKMPHTPYVRLTWFGTRQMNELAPLTITPRPDTMIRLFLDFEGLEQPIHLQLQALSGPARSGFTVVEWGGLLQKGK